MAEQAKEKKFEIRLSRSFQTPRLSGKPKTGVIYIRGGYKFCDAPCGDNPNGDFVIVPKSELHKFMMTTNTKFTNDKPEVALDPNLTMREVK